MQPIDFEGFAADCTISGKMTMFGERLTDFLNGQERFRIHHVVCHSLTDGHAAEIDSLSVDRNELLCVVATGPRGSEKHRINLATARLQVSLGPYIILGRLHTSPGSDVMATVLKREPMIPLTSATIAFERGGEIVARDVSTIIVNRLQVDWISPISDAGTIFPDSEVRSPYSKGLVKDFTGGSL